MPGLTLVHGDTLPRETLTSSLDTLQYLDDYAVSKVPTADRTYVAHTGYPAYSVRRFDTDDAVVVLEGHLYGSRNVEKQIRTVTSALLADDRDAVTEWLLDRDGDFLLLVSPQHRDGAILLADVFGRLPTYYAAIGDTVVVSRELKFLREYARRAGNPLDVDRLAVAQHLVFGYDLGSRTLFDGVRRLPPAGLAHVGDDIRVEQLHRFDLDKPAHRDRTVEENGAQLASLFTTACRQRNLDDHSNVVSLSGGLDSRAVAAGYTTAGVPYVARSFDNKTGRYAADVAVAEQIADALDADWSSYEASPTPADRRMLFDMKQGENFLGMAFILDFFDHLRSEHRPATYVTGDGGDKVFPVLAPSSSLTDREDLVRYVVEANGRFSLQEASAIANVDVETILDSVRARLAAYPEPDPQKQYAHFLVRERGLNLLVHGEDRNRYYFWSVTPFYSLPVFRYAMNVPDDQKEGQRLYKAFLRNLKPELLDLEYPNFGAPITSVEYRVKKSIYDLLSRYPPVRNVVVGAMRRNESATRDVAATVERQRSRTDLDPLSEQTVSDVTDRHDEYRPNTLYSLLTVTSLVEDLGGVRAEAEAPIPVLNE